jgi:hemerythrin superfamily protein
MREGDGIAFLIDDHAAIGALFERLARGRLDASRKQALVQELCTTLRIHLMLEEEIFYPAVRRTLGEAARVGESQAQHDAMKPLLAQLMSMHPNDIHFDATLRLLGEYVRLHFEQEEDEVFPRARASGINLRTVGAEMRARKRTLSSATIVLGEVLTSSL